MADKTFRNLEDFIAPFRVTPGRRVRLTRDYDPASRAHYLAKKDGAEFLQQGVALLSDYQARLAAQDTWGVLVVLQALDAAGKDGTIRHVMSGVNPQGVSVSSFKAPSAEELDHDFLWRYAQRLPRRGEIGIFNRSHYEEVLVVRVHPELLAAQRLPRAATRRDVWRRRYREINDWERYLTDNGLRVVKLLLNVSREEQGRRFLARIDSPTRTGSSRLTTRPSAASGTTTRRPSRRCCRPPARRWAPWHVIPADHKWFARAAAAAVIVQALKEIDPRYPKVDAATRTELLQAKAELEAEGGADAAPSADAAG